MHHVFKHTCKQGYRIRTLTVSLNTKYHGGSYDRNPPCEAHDHDRWPVLRQQRRQPHSLRFKLLGRRRRIAVDLGIAPAAAPVQERVGTARSRLATHRTLQRAGPRRSRAAPARRRRARAGAARGRRARPVKSWIEEPGSPARVDSDRRNFALRPPTLSDRRDDLSCGWQQPQKQQMAEEALELFGRHLGGGWHQAAYGTDRPQARAGQ